jgi:hypothetical protein
MRLVHIEQCALPLLVEREDGLPIPSVDVSLQILEPIVGEVVLQALCGDVTSQALGGTPGSAL